MIYKGEITLQAIFYLIIILKIYYSIQRETRTITYTVSHEKKNIWILSYNRFYK